MKQNAFRAHFQKCYLVLLLLLLVNHLATLLKFQPLVEITPYINGGVLVLALLVLLVEQPWRSAASVLLLAGGAWLFIESLFWGVGVFKEHLALMNEAAEAYILFFSAGLCIYEKREKPFLYWVLCLWTVLSTLFAAAALWATVTGTKVYGFTGETYLGIDEGLRLNLFIYATVLASILSISVLLAVIGGMVTKNKVGRIAFLLCVPVQFLALSLTDGRTGVISLGFGLGLLACQGLLRLARRQPKIKKTAAVCLCLAALGVCTVGTYLAMPASMKLVNSWAQPGGSEIYLSMDGVTVNHLFPTAGAEELTPEPPAPAVQEDEAVQHRSIMSGDMLSGRTYVWRAAVDMLCQEPLLLLKGTSVFHAMQHVMPYSKGTIEYVHVHNIYLQVLVETGVVGFGLMVAFLVLFAKAAIQLFFGKEQPLWVSLLPVPALMIALGEMVEGLTQLINNTPALVFFFLSAGFTIGHARRIKKSK